MTTYGPTYETRNTCFEMDADMFRLLRNYAMLGRDAALRAFFEGIEAGRIWPVASLQTEGR